LQVQGKLKSQKHR